MVVDAVLGTGPRQPAEFRFKNLRALLEEGGVIVQGCKADGGHPRSGGVWSGVAGSGAEEALLTDIDQESTVCQEIGA